MLESITKLNEQPGFDEVNPQLLQEQEVVFLLNKYSNGLFYRDTDMNTSIYSTDYLLSVLRILFLKI